jgi:hypothetical protein
MWIEKGAEKSLNPLKNQSSIKQQANFDLTLENGRDV